jgi:hypothetical protein
MAKDKRDSSMSDWVDDADERREREIQEHARRVARREKVRERQKGESAPQNRARTKTPR